MTGLCDRERDLVTGQLATFTGFGALSELDLQFVGIGEVVRSDAESTRSDLLDGLCKS